jgi:thioredoxin reductase (NADPH)
MTYNLLYTLLFATGTIALYLGLQKQRDRQNRKKLKEAERAGLLEPASLHPVIDPNRCLGSGSCVLACPEGDVLGMIQRRAQLINPSHCIGHGACKSACPHDAITLVFGSAKRGIDIPPLSPEFETNVPGIFIAGELGGMGLIRNAVEQGRQAMEVIRKRRAKANLLDVVIIGAGPAGFSASLSALQHKLRYVTLEQESLGGTVAHFPRGKVVMTQPVKLPIIGKVRFTETSKENLLQFWQDVEQRTGVKINYRERMESISPSDNGFVVTSSGGSYETRNVLLAIGRRGTPRKLGVPGEEQDKVVYRLIDAEQYRGQRVLVVGGGDAALEAACSIAEEPGTEVTLSYRGDGFSRAREKNRERVRQAESANRMRVMLSSSVREILADRVRIEAEGKTSELGNDAIIVCAGGILPTPFLKEVGIEVETKYGTA